MADGYLLDKDFYERLWLVLAEDPFVCEENLKLIKKICIKNGVDESTVRSFELKNIDWSEISDILSSVGFFGERLVTIRGSLSSLKDPDIKALTEILTDVDFNRIAVVLDYEEDKKGLPKKYDGLFSVAQKRGCFLKVEKINERFLASYITARAKKNGKKISNAVVRQIIDNIGSDMGLLTNEVDKYCFSVTGDEITMDVIDAIGVRNVDASVFNIVDNLSNGRAAQAIRTIDDLFGQKEEAVDILASLSSSFVDMHRCKLALNSRKTYQNVHEDFERKSNEYRYKKAGRNASRFSLKALDRILFLLMDADIRFKSSMTEGERQKRLKVIAAEIAALRNVK